MEHIPFDGTHIVPEMNNYQSCDELWQTLSPESYPCPELYSGSPLPPRQEQNPPCCLGPLASAALPLLEQFLAEERLLAQRCRSLSRHAPSREVAGTLRHCACSSIDAQKQLTAAMFLMTGEAYCRTPLFPPYQGMERLLLRDALRQLYHREACLCQKYRKAADDTDDPCLQEVLYALGEAAHQRALCLMDLLGRTLCKTV